MVIKSRARFKGTNAPIQPRFSSQLVPYCFSHKLSFAPQVYAEAFLQLVLTLLQPDPVGPKHQGPGSLHSRAHLSSSLL